MKQPVIAYTTSVGTLQYTYPPEDVIKAAAEGKRIPSHFLGSVRITDYLIARQLQFDLQRKYSFAKSQDIITRIKSFLDGKKKSGITLATSSSLDSLRLD